MKRTIMAFASVAAMTAATATAHAQQRGWDEGDWLSVAGTVNSVEEDSFTLDYGTGFIEVEFDALFADVDADEKLREGEYVTVYGEIDDDLWEGEVIDADHVFARDRAALYGGDTQTLSSVFFIENQSMDDRKGAWLTLEGEVTDVTGRELTLMTGGSKISVDTMEMDNNPLDDLGSQQIGAGDRVVVAGYIDNSLFDESELSAEYIYSIESNSRSASMAKNRSRAGERSMRTTDARASRPAQSKSAKNASMSGSSDRSSRRAARAESASDVSEFASEKSEFATIDTDQNGYISQREYVNAVSKPANISKQEARRLFDAAARDDDRLTRQEFITPNDEVERIFTIVLNPDDQ